jgi:hypothetical protein
MRVRFAENPPGKIGSKIRPARRTVREPRNRSPDIGHRTGMGQTLTGK